MKTISSRKKKKYINFYTVGNTEKFKFMIIKVCDGLRVIVSHSLNNKRIICAFPKWEKKRARTFPCENNVETFIFMCQLYIFLFSFHGFSIVNRFRMENSKLRGKLYKCFQMCAHTHTLKVIKRSFKRYYFSK